MPADSFTLGFAVSYSADKANRPGRPHTVVTASMCGFAAHLLCLTVLCTSPPVLAQAADEDRADAALFLQPPDVELVSLSPTGRYLAVTSFSPDGRRLQVRDRERNKLTVNYDLGHDYVIRSLRWATDKLMLVQQIERSRFGGFFGSRDLFSVDAGSGKLERIGRGEVIDILDGTRTVLVSESPDRFSEAQRLDVRSKVRRRAARSPSPRAEFIPDETGQIRFSIGDSQNARELVHLRDGGKWTEVGASRFDERGWTPWWFTGKPDHFYTRTSEGDAESTFGLGLYNSKTNEHRLLFRHPRADVTDLVFDFSQHNVIAVAYELHYPSWRYINAKHPLTQLHANMRKAFPQTSVNIVSATRDHSEAVIHISSDVNPGDYYLVNTGSKKADKLYTQRPHLADRTLARMSAVEVTARDGTTLYGYTTSHPDTPIPGPMVVLVHGGPYGVRDSWGFNHQVQLLAARGYHVLQINYRGSGGYGVDYLAAGIGEWGGLMQDDVTDATLWASAAGSAGSTDNPDLALARAEQICIMGSSYGAYAAMMGAIKEPGLYQCAIGTSGVYDMTLLGDRGDIRRTRAGEAYLRHIHGRSDAAKKAISPTHRAAEIKVPVLLIHGEQDFRAPVAHATGLRKALRAANNEPEYHELSNEGHATVQYENQLESSVQVLRFLRQHLDADQL